MQISWLSGIPTKPFYKELLEESEDAQRYRHVINSGAVGKPKDDDPRRCYVIVELDENTSMETPGSINMGLMIWQRQIGNDEQILSEFRRVCDEIQIRFQQFYRQKIKDDKVL